MRASLLALLVVARGTAASPVLPPELRWHLAARVGWSAFQADNQVDAVDGTSPIGELELEAHLPHVTFALWGDYSGFHNTNLLQGDGFTPIVETYAVRIADLGGRVSYDEDRFFIGVGTFGEDRRMTGSYGSRPYRAEVRATALELHVGFTFPKLGWIAPQIFGMWSLGSDGAVTARLTVGARI